MRIFFFERREKIFTNAESKGTEKDEHNAIKNGLVLGIAVKNTLCRKGMYIQANSTADEAVTANIKKGLEKSGTENIVLSSERHSNT